MSIAFDGARTLALQADHVDTIDSQGHHVVLAHDDALQGGVLRCARDASRCFVWWRKRRMLAELVRGALTAPVDVGDPSDLAISGDGTHVALVGVPGTIGVLNLATHQTETWTTPTPQCNLDNQYVSWVPGSEAVEFASLCPNSNSHVFRAQRDRPPVDVFASTAWVAGFGLTESGDLITNLRHYGASIVLIDAL